MAKLNYKHLGEGEPLIILHGLYGSSDNWVSVARELMADFSIYIIDIRNHGASPHLPEHNYQVMTDDLLEFMNEHEIYSAILMGHSMGGKIAMSFTALHPERVKKLIVVDISPRSYSIDSGDFQKNDHENILSALSKVNLREIKKRKDVDNIISEKIPSVRVRQFLLKNLQRNKDKGFSWKINIDVIQANLHRVLVGLEDEKDDLELYKNPALFIKGGNSDYILPVDEKMIYDYFENVKIENIVGASHWVHAEKPAEFISVLKEFLY